MPRPLTLVLVAAGCAVPPGEVAPAPVGQGGEPRGAVAINEVAAAVPGEPDFFEIVNRGGSPADLSGLFVADGLDRLDHYFALPAGTVLAPHARLVVQCGGAAAPGVVRAPFRLGRGDEIWLVAPDGVPLDGLPFLAPDDGSSLARLPDGEGLFFPAAPTRGARNDAPGTRQGGRSPGGVL